MIIDIAIQQFYNTYVAGVFHHCQFFANRFHFRGACKWNNFNRNLVDIITRLARIDQCSLTKLTLPYFWF
jgi:hypothetical protein